MITAYGTVENAVRAMQSGATNFIQKPWTTKKLLADVRAAVARQKAEEENVSAQARAQTALQLLSTSWARANPCSRFSTWSRSCTQPLDGVAARRKRDGKELIAKAIHLNSTRRDRPSFLSTPDRRRPTCWNPRCLDSQRRFYQRSCVEEGAVEVADRGTLFSMRSALEHGHAGEILRVLQDRKFMHLGGVQEIQADVRIIAPPNVDLRQMVKEGKFREDLFYRLN